MVCVVQLICVILFFPSAGITRIRFKGMISARSLKAPHRLIIQIYDLFGEHQYYYAVFKA